MSSDGILHFSQSFSFLLNTCSVIFVFTLNITITLASNVYYFIVTEVVILLIFTQYSAQTTSRIYTRNRPQCMLKIITILACCKRIIEFFILTILSHQFEKSTYIIFMHEFIRISVNTEKLCKVEIVIFVMTIISHHFTKIVSTYIQASQSLVRILLVRMLLGPTFLGILLHVVIPTVDFLLFEKL